MGFVSKNKTRQLLQNKKSGNFLLRFSESNREGAITFSWVEHTNRGVIFHDIDPFTKDELSRMSLADHIKTFRTKDKPGNPLIYLYPDKPKDSAFGRYYSNSNEIANNPLVDPYLKRKYVCQGENPTSPSSSPTPTEMELDQYLLDSPTPQMRWSISTEELIDEMISNEYSYNGNNNMDGNIQNYTTVGCV